MAEIRVLAPLDGTVVELESVPDEVFAQKMAGDGVAIDPSGQVAVAPVTGDLVKLFPGGHAFGISTGDGVELIVHVGLDTIELEGEGFENMATEGPVGRGRTRIVRFDGATVERLGKLIRSPVGPSAGGTIVILPG